MNDWNGNGKYDTQHVKCNELFKVVILNDTSKSWSEEDRKVVFLKRNWIELTM